MSDRDKMVKKETHTSQQRDGTVVTTTTTTTQMREDLHEFWDAGDIRVKYCLSLPGILRILEIIIGFIIVGCITAPFGSGPYLGVLGGQTYVLVVTSLCICITFSLLILFFFGFHLTILRDVAWREIDLLFCVSAVLLFLIATILEIWYATGTWQARCDHLQGDYQRCPSIGPWIAAAIFCLIEVVLYAASAFFAFKGKHYTEVAY